MYNFNVGERISVVASSRGDNLLEYVGTFIRETDEIIELENVEIGYLLLNFQKGIFGGNINKYKSGVRKVYINKKYIISCDK